MGKKKAMTLKEAVATLPKSLTEIVKFLKARHIKGEREVPTFCPIAVYLSKKTKKNVSVFGDEDEEDIEAVNGETERVKAPASIRHFVAEFDDGKYPELDWNPKEEQ